MKTGAASLVASCRGAIVALACAAWVPVMAGTCSVGSSGLVFGPYQPLTFPGKLTSSAVTSTATVSVVCSGIVDGGSYSVAAGPGTHGPGNRISTRYLANTNGGAQMVYNLYVDPSYSTVWGNAGIGSTLGGTMPSGSSNLSHTVYGRVPAEQHTLRAGTFSDTLTLTLTYNP